MLLHILISHKVLFLKDATVPMNMNMATCRFQGWETVDPSPADRAGTCIYYF